MPSICCKNKKTKQNKRILICYLNSLSYENTTRQEIQSSKQSSIVRQQEIEPVSHIPAANIVLYFSHGNVILFCFFKGMQSFSGASII